MKECVERVNSRLSRWETIQEFRILDRDLTVQDQELTPSMKVRRKVVEAEYRAVLDSMCPTGPLLGARVAFSPARGR